ncbi:amino acid adenylation domain-containing protein [Corallococcus sp. M34]|uniref:non-ribosomal peptide synthetase n=1 Tax=Citreicoccus inhibens TaxID=2849499 RepID=UPI001C244E17|nr:non-ribosomal peptide synthetase [Citreicoccus inhibens]MBU8900321.1 amino acid adenylation domain-containing protein [Citreicoccus inhibens]
MALPSERFASSSTLAQLMERRAESFGERPLYSFVSDGEADEVLSYAGLELRARRIAAVLQSLAQAGERAVLLYPPGLEYIAGFFGCLQAGLVAVPAYPPDPSRLERTLPRLRAIIRDARASVVLTTSFIQGMGEAFFADAPELAALRWLATDTVPEGAESTWRRPEATRDTLAFLQYTSGSTGDPKGVQLTHGNLLHNLGLITDAFQVHSDSVGVIWLPPYHDMGLIGGILQPLAAGIPVALMSPLAFLRRPRFWLETLTRFGGTISGGPCFAFDLCVRKVSPDEREGLDLRRWEMAFCGAEPIRPEVMARFQAAFAPAGFQGGALYPCYGLAEGTLIASGGRKGEGVRTRAWDAAALERNEAVEAREGEEARTLVGCGTTLAEQRLLIVEPESRRACAPGRVGEIWLSGPSVATGYWARLDESREAFEARLADSTEETRWLRTGDLGLLRDGELFVVGRRKDLIILRGRNLHPQDLEVTLERAHPALRPGCGAAFSIEVAGEERLAVMYEVDPRKAWTPEDVLGAVRRALSETHEVQLHALVLIEPGALPKTSSGKVQRRACRAELLEGAPRALLNWREGAVSSDAKGLVAQAGPAGAPDSVASWEAWLLTRLAERLRIHRDTLDKDVPITSFGLDSLAAVELANDLEQVGARSGMEALLQGPTVAELARRLAASRGSGHADAIPRRADSLAAPLTATQQRLWLFEQLGRGVPAYHLPAAARLVGPLDVDALDRAVAALIGRHDALRVTFQEEDGIPSQRVAREMPSVFRRVSLRDVPMDAREAAALRLAQTEARTRFDLTRGPLLRVTLFQLDAQVHLLVVVVHHLVSDGASFGILARELSALYAAFRDGRAPALPLPPVRFLDFAHWRAAQESEDATAPSLESWRRKLAGVSGVLELPSDHVRPSRPTHAGARVPVQVSARLTARLEALGREEGATLFMTVLAAFQALLHRHSGQDDFCIGTPIQGRERAGLDGVMGCFLELLVLRASVSGTERFRDLLRRARETSLDAFANRHVPFERIVEAVLPVRDRSRAPLFQVLFVLQPEPREAWSLAGLESQAVELEPRATPYDLTLSLTRGAAGLAGWMEYATDLFDAASATRLVERLHVVLEAIIEQPELRVDSLPLMPDDEQRLLATWNDTHQEVSEDCVHTLIASQAAQTPDAVALVCGEESLTWRELERQSRAVALRLRARGVGPGVVVGLCVDRSLELVVGMLGILQAGGAYLPLDPTYPEARLAFMLSDSGASVVLTQAHLADGLPTGGRGVVLLTQQGARDVAEPPLMSDVGPDHVAYVLYTSGSTGQPKGVLVSHRNVAHFLAGMDARLARRSGTWLAVTSVSFDISVLEVLWTLARGFQVVLLAERGVLATATVPGLIRRHAVTHLQCTPSFAEALLLEPGAASALSGLEALLVGGEALGPELASRLRERVGGALLNMYGPTETTVWSATHRVTGAPGPVPIGTPIVNTRLHVLDAGLRPTPIGVPGELFIGGAGVAQGYHARPALTAERFVPDPFSSSPGARLYRTGDRARWRGEGTAEFLGRVDFQLKVRGFRVEPGEIESALSGHPGVRQVVVVARQDEGAGARLVAFVVAQPGATVGLDALRAFARQTLPEHLVPSAWALLEKLPLTLNGKVDRKALPAPEGARDATRPYLAPRSDTELRVAAVWSALLGVERVGADDDFFALGGHSLLATRAAARLREALGVELSLRDVFEAGTLSALAARLDALPRGSAQGARPGATAVLHSLSPEELARLTARAGAVEDVYPLSPLQHGLLFQELVSPGGESYFEQLSWTLTGPLEVGAMRRAWELLGARHAVLRTSFHWEGLEEPLQVVHPQAELPWREEDWRTLSEAERAARWEDFTREDRARGFALQRAPLSRVAVVRVGEQSWRWLWSFHHLVLDGWSFARVLRELLEAYAALTRGEVWTPAPVPPFRAYLAWLARRPATGDEEFWREQLAGFESPTPLPGASDARDDGVGERDEALSDAESNALQEFSRRHRVTPSTLVHGAWALLLARYGGGEDIAFGTTLAGRPPELAGAEESVGLFIQTVPVRTRLRPTEGLLPWLRELQSLLVALAQRGHVPLTRIQGWSEVPRGTPLFESLLVFENYPVDEALSRGGAGLSLHGVHMHERTHYPLTAVALPGRTLRLKVQFQTARVPECTAVQMLGHWRALLREMAEGAERRLAEVPLLSEVELQRVLVEWNASRTTYPREATVHSLFQAQAARTPDAVAVEYEGSALTYAQLARRANQLAHRLAAMGVRRGDTVAVCVERSPAWVVGLLGILQAGAAYVPLDPTYPTERLAWMLGDSRASVLLTQSALSSRWSVGGVPLLELDALGTFEGMPATVLESGASAEDLAYVIYTSGSTGTPKGVGVPHRAVARLVVGTNFIQWRPDDRVAQASNASFDAATFEVWGALLQGARLVGVSRERALEPRSFAAWLREQDIRVMFLTTAWFNQVVAEVPDAFRTVRQVHFGGEAVDPRAVRAVLREGGPERLLHVYGPTESTTFATWHLVDAVAEHATTVPMGRPLANTEQYVLDAGLMPVPPGGAGELWLGGDGLAWGYLRQPALTAERFVPNPYAAAPGARLYRTGDRVRLRLDGAVEFLGRVDAQVKVRGFRVEPAEVEAALLQHPEVREAVVLAREEVSGGSRQLVAYVVASSVTPTALRTFLSEHLPSYLVPAALVRVERLPLTPNGKVDRRALPAPAEAEWAEAGTGLVAPRDPSEELVAGLFRELLGVSRVGVRDSFFDLGGHSLMATRVVARILAACGVSLSLRDLFENPTVEGLASRIAQVRGQTDARRPPPIVPVRREGRLPLSLMQERLWLLEQLQANRGVYNVRWAAWLEGDLNVAALEQALAELLRRHESLRTTISMEAGEPVQRIHDAVSLSLPVVDLSDIAEAEREEQALRAAAESARRPFDLAQGPLIRPVLIRTGARTHLVVLTLHHIISDGWSLGVTFRELAALYSAALLGRASALPAPGLQPVDHAVWQRSWLQGDALEEQIAYWRQQLHGAAPVLELPTDLSRPAVQRFHGATLPVQLPAGLSSAFRALCRREGVTPFMGLMAVFQLLLARVSGQQDVSVGSPISGRHHAGLENLIGFFVNMLVLRTRFAPDISFRELLGHVRETTLAAYAHQDVPFERVVEALQPPRTMSHAPLMQVVLSLNDSPPSDASLEGLSLRPVELNAGTAKFDLALAFDDSPEGFSGTLEYDTDLFTATTATRWMAQLRVLMEGAVEDPGQRIGDLPLMDDAERRRLMVSWNGPRTEFPREACLATLFEAQVARTPDAFAVEFEGVRLTYRELDRRGNQLARYLLRRGITPGTPVGLCVRRSLELIIGTVGIIKAGAAYVPLDPTYPRDRLAYMVGDTRLPVILVQRAVLDVLPEGNASVVILDDQEGELASEREDSPGITVPPESLAYIMYTSGSTGRPKGVCVPQRGVARLVLGQSYLQWGPSEVFTQLAPICFDVATMEIWGALLHGSRLVVLPPRPPTAEELKDLVARCGVTVLWLTAALFESVAVTRPDVVDGVRQFMSGGDALSPAAVRERLSRGGLMVNGYGPTEVTTFTTCAVMEGSIPEGSVSIGKPIANTQVYVVDRRLHPVPVGVPGELLAGGEGIAWGYLGRPELTAERFIPDPFSDEPGARLYRTGDSVRWREDGTLEFLGRIDTQVKVRGYRVEPGEVEEVLRRHPAVGEAVVVARPDPAGGKRLIAYAVPRAGETLDARVLKAALVEALPEFMVPSVVVPLDRMPVSPNGKVDRAALPEPEVARAPGATFVAPTTEMERKVAELWSRVLGVEDIGVEDHFFTDLAGSSMSVVKACTLFREEMKRDVPATRFFEHSTVRAFAAALERDAEESAEPQDNEAHEDRAAQRRQAIRRQGRRGNQGNG